MLILNLLACFENMRRQKYSGPVTRYSPALDDTLSQCFRHWSLLAPGCCHGTGGNGGSGGTTLLATNGTGGCWGVGGLAGGALSSAAWSSRSSPCNMRGMVVTSLRTGTRRGRIRIEYVNRIVYRIGSFKPTHYPHPRLMYLFLLLDVFGRFLYDLQ